jgi:hypothetical protein
MSHRAKAVKKYFKELLNGVKSYDQIDHAIANYAGEGVIDVLRRVTDIVWETQSHSKPDKLIKSKLKSRYGDEFEGLVGVFVGVSTSKNGQITMPKDWKKLRLPVILNTNSENPAEEQGQNGFETRLLPQQILPVTPFYYSKCYR